MECSLKWQFWGEGKRIRKKRRNKTRIAIKVREINWKEREGEKKGC